MRGHSARKGHGHDWKIRKAKREAGEPARRARKRRKRSKFSSLPGSDHLPLLP